MNNVMRFVSSSPVFERATVWCLLQITRFFDPDKLTKSCGDEYDEDTCHVLYECTKYNDSRTKLILHLPNQQTVSFYLI
jgi:hypothetical protein